MQWEPSRSGGLLWQFCDSVMLSPQTDFGVLALKIPNTRYKVETRQLNVLNFTLSVWKRRPYDVSLWKMGAFIWWWFCAPLDAWPCHKELTGLAPNDTVAECQVLYVLFMIVFPCQWDVKQLSVCRIILRAVINLVPLRKKITLICSIKVLHMFCISNILCKIIRLLYYSAQMTGQLYLSCLWNEVNWVSSNFAFIHLGGRLHFWPESLIQMD